MRSLLSDDLRIGTRRSFLCGASIAAAATVFAGMGAAGEGVVSAADRERMRALAAWTALTFDTPNPVPYGADIVDSKSGERLMQAANAVGP